MRVYEAEIKHEIWPLSAALGVTKTVASITELSALGLVVVVDFAGFGTTTADAIEVVRPGGCVVQVGLGVLAATINT